MGPRPFRSQFLVFMEKTVFVHEDKLLWRKVVRGSLCVELLACSVRGIFVVLARHLSSKQQFSDDVVSSGLPIEFAAYVRRW